MNKMALTFVLLLSLSTYATKAAAAPFTCNSQTTVILQELVYKLSVDGTIKQSRYEKMMNAFASATDCEAVNKLMLLAVGDCTIKSLKKSNCQ